MLQASKNWYSKLCRYRRKAFRKANIPTENKTPPDTLNRFANEWQ